VRGFLGQPTGRTDSGRDRYGFSVKIARGVQERLKAAGVRAELDESGDKIGKKIRSAETRKIPAMFVIGGKEAEAGQVALRRHGKGGLGAQSVDEAMASLLAEIKERRA
jgi:threonyl-tRNA synthetase